MKKKNIIFFMIAALGVGTAMPVMAETATYNFFFEEGQSHRMAPASKADGEQNYYVTQTFSAATPNELPRTRYYSYYNGNRISKPLNLRCDDFKHHYEAYTTHAPTGSGYDLFGEYVSGTGTGSIQIVGRWTP